MQPGLPSPANQLADDGGDSYLQYAPKKYQVRCHVALVTFFTIAQREPTPDSQRVNVWYPSEDPNLQPGLPPLANQLAYDVDDSYLQYAPKQYQVRCQVAFFTIPQKEPTPDSQPVTARYPLKDPNLQPGIPPLANQLAYDVCSSYL